MAPRSQRPGLLVPATVGAALLLAGKAAPAAPGAPADEPSPVSRPGATITPRPVAPTPGGERALTLRSETDEVLLSWPASESWQLASPTRLAPDGGEEAATGLVAASAPARLSVSATQPGLYLVRLQRSDGATFTLRLSRPARRFDAEHGYPPGTRYGVVRV